MMMMMNAEGIVKALTTAAEILEERVVQKNRWYKEGEDEDGDVFNPKPLPPIEKLSMMHVVDLQSAASTLRLEAASWAALDPEEDPGR
jgi:hypothetical protein